MKMHGGRAWVSAAVIALGMAVAASPASAQTVEEEGKGVFRNILTTFAPPSAAERQRIAQELELTQEQRAEMQAITQRYAGEASALREQYRAAYRDVVRLMNAESPDGQEVDRTLRRFHEVHARVLSGEVDYWMDVKEVLTAKQNLKLWELFEQARIRR